MRKQKLYFFLKLFFSFLLIIYLFTKINFDRLSLINFSFLPWFIIGLLIGLLSLFIMSFRWHHMIKTYLDTNLNFLTAFQYYLTGSFFNIFMPG
ncbi:MAG: lysylphosphatidylglycerol synthase domain-containing protein, partial [bacterium]